MKTSTANLLSGCGLLVFTFGVLIAEPVSMLIGLIGFIVGAFYYRKNVNEAIDAARRKQ